MINRQGKDGHRFTVQAHGSGDGKSLDDVLLGLADMIMETVHLASKTIRHQTLGAQAADEGVFLQGRAIRNDDAIR